MRNITRVFFNTVFVYIVLVNVLYSQNCDTICVYKDNVGIRNRVIFNWIRHKNYSFSDKSYSRMNHQDSMLLRQDTNVVFRFLNKPNGKTILDARFNADWTFSGVFKYYYRNGNVKRIENWGIRQKDTCGFSLMVHDSEAPNETWSYFDRKKRLKRTITYKVNITNCEPITYSLTQTRILYSRRGSKSRTKVKLLESASF